ncbi:TPA: glycosyltransferase family 2 protein [Candidatus Poribacteria bacterium]|nr:glycosyltransferase family 2 protein [Candidatus Poribacteria bacterium]
MREMFQRLSVVIPVYNEVNTIERVLERVKAVQIPLEKEIIIVDDGSTDGTREKLGEIQKTDPSLKIILHERNRGKGAALRTGFQHVTGQIVIIQDADLEYNPEEYPKLLEPILDGRADAVYGSRFLGGTTRRVTSFWHYMANKFLTFLSNMLMNLNLTDMETCYKVIRTDVLRRLNLRGNRFEIEPEITAKLARSGCRIYEVPISYSGRDVSEGKKIKWKDGIAAIYYIVRFKLRD